MKRRSREEEEGSSDTLDYFLVAPKAGWADSVFILSMLFYDSVSLGARETGGQEGRAATSKAEREENWKEGCLEIPRPLVGADRDISPVELSGKAARQVDPLRKPSEGTWRDQKKGGNPCQNCALQGGSWPI